MVEVNASEPAPASEKKSIFEDDAGTGLVEPSLEVAKPDESACEVAEPETGLEEASHPSPVRLLVYCLVFSHVFFLIFCTLIFLGVMVVIQGVDGCSTSTIK